MFPAHRDGRQETPLHGPNDMQLDSDYFTLKPRFNRRVLLARLPSQG